MKKIVQAKSDFFISVSFNKIGKKEATSRTVAERAKYEHTGCKEHVTHKNDCGNLITLAFLRYTLQVQLLIMSLETKGIF